MDLILINVNNFLFLKELVGNVKSKLFFKSVYAIRKKYRI